MEATITKARFEKYPSYKNSGVEWLGEIPVGWGEPEKVKFISVLKGRLGWQGLKANEYTDEGPYILSSAHFNNHKIHWDECPHVSQERYELDSNIQLRVGDLLLMKDGAKMGKLAFLDYLPGLACLNSHLLLFRPKIKNGKQCYFSKYLFYVFQTNLLQDYIQINGTGATFSGISQESIGNYPICLPQVPEQTAIAAFLDDKTAKIDKTIAQKEKLIALLQERKQIIIQNAVTKGLNPHAKMKPSSVDWIGEIPEGWEVVRSKYLFTQRKEFARREDVQLSATQAYGVIPQDDYEEKIGRRVVKIQLHLEKRKHVEVDDFVISMRSFQGGLERAWSSGCIRSSYIVLRPLEEIDPGFYGYLFKTATYIKALQMTASFIRDGQDLNFDNFSRVDLFIPPLEDQKKICTFLQTQSKKIEKAIALQEKQIEKLKVYKSTLIDSAITGKIKVTTS